MGLLAVCRKVSLKKRLEYSRKEGLEQWEIGKACMNHQSQWFMANPEPFDFTQDVRVEWRSTFVDLLNWEVENMPATVMSRKFCPSF